MSLPRNDAPLSRGERVAMILVLIGLAIAVVAIAAGAS